MNLKKKSIFETNVTVDTTSGKTILTITGKWRKM